jgi:tetratricopeptide (TPR) repeat protein
MVVIIARKFSQLSLLDVANIPEVAVQKQKDGILKKRLLKQATLADAKRREMVRPIIQAWKNLQLKFRQYVGRLQTIILEYHEKRKKSEPREKRLKKKEDLRVVLQEGRFALEQKKLEEAEKKFLSAIRIDARNEEAYLGLGEVYWGQNNFSEAKETLKFLLQLNPQHEEAMVILGAIAEQEGKKDEAVEYYQQAVLLHDSRPALFAKLANLLQELDRLDAALEAIKQAVELEPQNPKYLDNKVELSVLCGNKKLAEESWRELRMTNPENQKLALWKEKIDQLP